MSRSRWMKIDSGRLTIWHRPKLKSLPALKQSGCDEIVTLLSDREGGRQFGAFVQEAGIAWTWFPMKDGQPPSGVEKEKLLRFFPELVEKLKRGKSVLIHCSAGIHRTGMVAYGVLRCCGLSEQESLELIAAMRPVTAASLQRKHLDWFTDCADSSTDSEPN